MGREEVLPTIVTDLPAHPAVAAWAAAEGRADHVVAVTPLKPQHKAGQKSGVYRLHLENERHDIVAKRCRRKSGVVESLIYQRILPQTGLPVLEFFGSVDDADERYMWLFLEDAGQEEAGDADGILIARWLGRLHASAAGIARELNLPRRGAEHYYEHLTSALNRLAMYEPAPHFSPEDRKILAQVARQCQVVAQHWPLIVEFLGQLPETLVHGDFVPKNLRMRGMGSQRHLVALDWETAGIATPAADLAELAQQFGVRREEEVRSYRESSGNLWQGFSLQTLERAAQFGTLLRLLASVDWMSYSLAYPWPQKPIRKLQSYEEYLSEIFDQLGWEGSIQ